MPVANSHSNFAARELARNTSQAARHVQHNRAILTIRSAIFWCWSIALTLILAVPVMLGCLISFDAGYAVARIWIAGNLHGLRILCGVQWRVEGEHNIPDTPCVVLSKHQSTWETYFLPWRLHGAVFVAKRSLLWIPVVGWVLGLLRFIMIDRKAGRSAIRQMVEQARERLALRRWIVIFPEGTRRVPGAKPDYRIGGAVVAAKTGTRVLPVATNAGEFWPRMGFIKWPGTITIRFGPCIDTHGKEPAAILAETQRWIETRMSDISVPDRFPY